MKLHHIRNTVPGMALAALFLAGGAQAQKYPTAPVRLVIPFTAGGFSDVVGRIVGDKLSEIVGQPMVIDNRAGASGIIGTDIVAKAPGDGYTLLLNSFNHVVNPSLLRMPFDPVKDFAAVSLIAEGPPLVMMVHPSLPVKSVKELIALAKKRPGQLNYGSSGVGTSGHLIGELFKLTTGTGIVHVPYRGSGASMTAVISGEVAMVSTYMPVALPHVKGGKLRALAVTGARRSPVLPDAPTMGEAGVPRLEVSGFAGLLAPASTPRAIVNQLNGAVVRMARQPDFVKRFAAYDMTPVAGTPEEFVRYTEREIARWAKVIKDAGIHAQ